MLKIQIIRSNFIDIFINGNMYKAFIDFGSDCSVIKLLLAEKFKIPICKLRESIVLSGFLGVRTMAGYYIIAQTQIDEVTLEMIMSLNLIS